MATVKLWSGVSVSMQSALAASKTVTAITKAAPGVASSTAHGFINGDYLFMTVQGMNELNNRVVRANNIAANTFEMLGDGAASIDTTNFGTFASGGAQLITFGTSLATLTDINASGGTFGFEDTTTIHDLFRTQIPTVADPATFTFNSFWDPADAGLAALKIASDTKAQRAFRMSWPDGGRIAFAGYVGASLIPTGQAQGKVTTSVTITAFGRISVFTS